jgi:hypothetical protein
MIYKWFFPIAAVQFIGKMDAGCGGKPADKQKPR